MKNEIIKDIAVDFVKALGIAFTSVIVSEENERMWVTLVPQENTSRYIGYRGQNIAAIQHLFTLLLWTKGFSREDFIVFDIDGYKKKNEEKILTILIEKISLINKTQETQTMPFLGPAERRMVHLLIQSQYPEYDTESFTDEKKKRVLRISKKTVQDSLL